MSGEGSDMAEVAAPLSASLLNLCRAARAKCSLDGDEAAAKRGGTRSLAPPLQLSTPCHYARLSVGLGASSPYVRISTYSCYSTSQKHEGGRHFRQPQSLTLPALRASQYSRLNGLYSRESGSSQ